MEVLVIVVLLAVAWYWYDSSLAKEAAVGAARRACERHNQQLLDETVALMTVRPQRDASGRMRLLRDYRFEFSGDGERRSSGEISLLGQRVTGLNLSLENHTVYEQEDERSH